MRWLLGSATARRGAGAAMLDPAVLDGWRSVIGAGVAAVGAVLLVLGACGFARQPDVYARAHASAIIDGPGVGLVLVGVAVAAWDWRAAILLSMAAGLRLWASPGAVRAILAAALAIGETPQARARTDDASSSGGA